jgi:hypothetical protein
MTRGWVALLAGLAALVVRGAPARAQTADDVRAVAADQDPNFEVQGTASGTHYALSPPPGTPGTSGNREGLSMNLIAFQRPLRDDDWPYSLQAFAQRENRFSISVAAGHFDTANALGGVDRTQWDAGAGAAFNAYLKRWFIVFADVSYAYFDLHDVDLAQTTHAFAAGAGVGFRYRDTRVDLSVGEQGNRIAGAFGPWHGSLALSAFTVIHRRVALTATGSLVQGSQSGESGESGKSGKEGFFQAELFPTKATGVFASGFAGRFEPYSAPVVATRYVGSAGFAGWFDATTALVGVYSLTYETDPATPQVTNGYNELSHTLQLEAYFRFP